MRTLRLARIAAEAEGIRLRYAARRAANRAVFGVVALLFLFGALVFCHIAGWYWLRMRTEPPATAMILAGVDLVLAAFLALLAARSSPSRLELEAQAVRQRAWEATATRASVTAAAIQILRLAAPLFRRSPH